MEVEATETILWLLVLGFRNPQFGCDPCYILKNAADWKSNACKMHPDG
jgi:hypothetical protein